MVHTTSLDTQVPGAFHSSKTNPKTTWGVEEVEQSLGWRSSCRHQEFNILLRLPEGSPHCSWVWPRNRMLWWPKRKWGQDARTSLVQCRVRGETRQWGVFEWCRMEVLRHASYLGSAPETSQGMVQCVMGSHSAVAARSLDLALDTLLLCIPPCMPTNPPTLSLNLTVK